MNFNKWRNYLTEAKENKEEEALEVEAEFDMDGKVISNKTPEEFEEDGRVKHNDKGEGVIVNPDVRGDFVLVKFDNDDEERMVPYGELEVLSTDDDDDDKEGDDEDKKDDKDKGENDEMMLGEMCGALPPPEEPAVMIPKMTRKVVPHDDEGRMAKSQLYKIAKYAMEMMENLHDDDELEGWVQAKITKAASYMSAAKHYLEYEYKHPPEPDMPMVHKATPMDEIMPMMESTQKKVDEIIEGVIGSKKKSS